MRSGLGALEGVAFEALFALVEGRTPTLKGIIDFELYTSFSVSHIIMSVCFTAGLSEAALSGAITGPGTGALKGTNYY